MPTIDRYIPAVERMAKTGLGWEDIMVLMRFDSSAEHVVKAIVLRLTHAAVHQREAANSDRDQQHHRPEERSHAD